VISIQIPTTDVNSETALVLRWYAADRATVREGEPVVEVETSKAILDVEAPSGGVLRHEHGEGQSVKIEQALGQVFDSLEALETFERERREAAAAAPAAEQSGRITAPARRRAQELGIEIGLVADRTEGLVTSRHVDEFASETGIGGPAVELPEPLEAPAGVRRLLLIGAGLGATQVIDILSHDERAMAVAVADDQPARHGEIVAGVPVIGGLDHAVKAFGERRFDAAVIAISTSVPARTRLRRRCEEAGIPLANVIDPTARIATGVTMGTGNVICAFCHFGVDTKLGDNNFLSAYNSFDHHNVLGSDISTGPGCMTSGLVEIGDRCRLGTGIFIEPHVHLGAGVQVASGAVIVASVPADHAVKTRSVTTAVVPLRPPA
jgi:acetyltransferase-like isoleucine patch superfamily enzyme